MTNIQIYKSHFDLHKVGQAQSTIFAMRPSISKSTKDSLNIFFCASSSRDITFFKCWFQKVGQVHCVQFRNSVTNVKIYKWLSHFCASSYCLRVNIIFIFYLQKVGQGHVVTNGVILVMTPFDGKYQNVLFALALTVREILFFHFNLQKVG